MGKAKGNVDFAALRANAEGKTNDASIRPRYKKPKLASSDGKKVDQSNDWKPEDLVKDCTVNDPSAMLSHDRRFAFGSPEGGYVVFDRSETEDWGPFITLVRTEYGSKGVHPLSWFRIMDGKNGPSIYLGDVMKKKVGEYEPRDSLLPVFQKILTEMHTFLRTLAEPLIQKRNDEKRAWEQHIQEQKLVTAAIESTATGYAKSVALAEPAELAKTAFKKPDTKVKEVVEAELVTSDDMAKLFKVKPGYYKTAEGIFKGFYLGYGQFNVQVIKVLNKNSPLANIKNVGDRGTFLPVAWIMGSENVKNDQGQIAEDKFVDMQLIHSYLRHLGLKKGFILTKQQMAEKRAKKLESNQVPN
jgi:hypothetical protein